MSGVESDPKVEPLIALVKANNTVGFIFPNSHVGEIEKQLLHHVCHPVRSLSPFLFLPSPYYLGSCIPPGRRARQSWHHRPNSVIVRKGPTGMEPTQTSFLQALIIASKINKGQVEIVSDVHLINAWWPGRILRGYSAPEA